MRQLITLIALTVTLIAKIAMVIQVIIALPAYSHSSSLKLNKSASSHRLAQKATGLTKILTVGHVTVIALFVMETINSNAMLAKLGTSRPINERVAWILVLEASMVII